MMGDPWIRVTKFDRRAIDIYQRHYSCRRYADGRRRRQFAPPGETVCLLTPLCDALFGWVYNLVPRYDGQEGVNCFVFRNESSSRASDLIRAAMEWAWHRWPRQRRLFTYVDPVAVRGTVPGYCFIRAGWRRCGMSKGGLVILEYTRVEVTGHE